MRACILWAAGAAVMSWFMTGCVMSPPVSRDLGARCDSHADCAERCLAGAPSLYPDGFCSLSCDADRDCPDGSTCVAMEEGVCLFACADARQCGFLGSGWDCVPRIDHAGKEVSVCLGQ